MFPVSCGAPSMRAVAFPAARPAPHGENGRNTPGLNVSEARERRIIRRRNFKRKNGRKV